MQGGRPDAVLLGRVEKRSAFRRMNITDRVCAESAYGGMRFAFPPYGLAMQKRLHEMRPDASLHGFSVQTMARRPHAHELIVGVSTDPVFGPVILFGQGGIAVEVTADRALALPPLNMVLARDVVSRTRVAKLLAGYRNRPPADIDAICRTLIQISNLIADIPEIVELDINPLLADENGVIALDARMRVAPASVTGPDRFAIRPYPEELEERISWQGKPLLLRPIKPEDGPQHMAFFKALDPEDVRYMARSVYPANWAVSPEVLDFAVGE